MRLLKILLITVLVLSAVFYFGCLIYYNSRPVPREQVVPSVVAASKKAGIEWIPVRWVPSGVSDRGALYLPVWLDTISKPFWMQFDLGTPYSDLLPINDYFPYLKRKEQRLQRLSFHQNEPVYDTGITLNIGNRLLYKATALPIYDRLQQDTLVELPDRYDTKIGNLGYDLIAGRILLLDFKKGRIAITDELPALPRIQWLPRAQVAHYPIFIPLTIDGKEKLVQYDNGSSAFTLLLGKEDWDEWRSRSQKVDTFTGYSWGKKEFYYKALPAQRLMVAGMDVSQQPIWSISRMQPVRTSWLGRLKKFTDRRFGKTIGGLAGNEYFRDHLLILDARNNRLGIIINGLD